MEGPGTPAGIGGTFFGGTPIAGLAIGPLGIPAKIPLPAPAQAAERGSTLTLPTIPFVQFGTPGARPVLVIPPRSIGPARQPSTTTTAPVITPQGAGASKPPAVIEPQPAEGTTGGEKLGRPTAPLIEPQPGGKNPPLVIEPQPSTTPIPVIIPQTGKTPINVIIPQGGTNPAESGGAKQPESEECSVCRAGQMEIQQAMQLLQDVCNRCNAQTSKQQACEACGQPVQFTPIEAAEGSSSSPLGAPPETLGYTADGQEIISLEAA